MASTPSRAPTHPRRLPAGPAGLAGLVVAAALLSGTAAALPTAAAQPTPAATPAAARVHPGVTCPMGTPVVEPTFVPISCGDGSAFVIHVRWTYLSTRLGRAKGVVLVDDCLPDCAEGHYHAYGARLVFTGVATTHGQPYFTRARIHFTSRHPAQGPKVWTVTY